VGGWFETGRGNSRRTDPRRNARTKESFVRGKTNHTNIGRGTGVWCSSTRGEREGRGVSHIRETQITKSKGVVRDDYVLSTTLTQGKKESKKIEGGVYC